EGRYSEISREMVEGGDWVTPRLNGIKYFEQPPLQYWATPATFALCGGNKSTSRLYIALAGLATILVVGFTAWRLGGIDWALAPLLVVVSRPLFLGPGGLPTP